MRVKEQILSQMVLPVQIGRVGQIRVPRLAREPANTRSIITDSWSNRNITPCSSALILGSPIAKTQVVVTLGLVKYMPFYVRH